MSDEEILALLQQGKLQAYRLEQDLKDCTRAVAIRRKQLGTFMISSHSLIKCRKNDAT
jgi:hypothetical protein